MYIICSLIILIIFILFYYLNLDLLNYIFFTKVNLCFNKEI